MTGAGLPRYRPRHCWASQAGPVLTLLLVMFVYAVIRLPPEPAGSPEPPVLTPAAPRPRLGLARSQLALRPARRRRLSGWAIR